MPPRAVTEVHFTPLVQEAVRAAASELERLGHDAIRAEHLLLGVLSVPSGSAVATLEALGRDGSDLRSRVTVLLPPGVPAEQRGEYPYHATGIAALENAMAEARESGSGTVTTARLMLGVMRTENPELFHALASAGLEIPLLFSELRARPEDPPEGGSDGARAG